MDLTLYSKYRTPLMGIAMIMVILYHQIGKPASFETINIINLVCSTFHGGTDIFIFFSGMGLYFSMKKNNNGAIHFYKRRLIRIIPCYYIVILFIAFFSIETNISIILQQLSIFGFILPPPIKISSYDWFVPSIIVLYIIFPFYYKNFKNSPWLHTIVACIIGITLTFIIIYIQKGTIILFFSRIPTFFIGTLFGYILNEKKNLTGNLKFIYSLLFIAIIAFIILLYLTILYNNDSVILRKNGITHIPYIFITPGLCLFLCYILSLLDKFSFSKSVGFILSFIGSISFEIYLIHMGLPRTVLTLNCNNIQTNILNILLAFSISVFVKFITESITNKRINNKLC